MWIPLTCVFLAFCLGYGLGGKHTRDVMSIKAKHGQNIELGEETYELHKVTE